MTRAETVSRRRGHAAFALALAACAVLTALWAKAPAFGEEIEATGQTGAKTVNVQFSNVERSDGDYDKWAWPVKYDLYEVGDVGGPIMWVNDSGSIMQPWMRLEPGFTVSGQGYKANDGWIVVNRTDDGRYANSVWGTVSDTDGDGVSDHIDIVARYGTRYTPQVFNELGETIPVTKVTCRCDQSFPRLQNHTWEAPFENIATGISLHFPAELPAKFLDNGDLVITSNEPNTVASSVEFVMEYDPLTDTIRSFLEVNPEYKKGDIDKPVENNPVDVPPVKGDTGITSSGTLQGANIPADAEIVLEAAEVTEGDEYAALIDQTDPTMLYGMFKVDMTVNGEKVHDGFGTLALSFPVDAKYEGYMFRVLHLHEDGTVTVERAFAKDGLVTVKVTDLSTFALEIGEKPVADAEEEEAPKVPAKLDTAPAKADESPAALAATGDGMLVPGVLALALVIGLATMLVSRKAAEKRMK